MNLRSVRVGWIATLVCAMLTGVASAGAPLQKFQAPGFYRTMVGDFEVTALSDGSVPFNVHELLTNITPRNWMLILHARR